MIFTSLRASTALLRPSLHPPSTLILARRLLSSSARETIQNAVRASPVVLFMKGTPALPQCGFSRAAIQVLSLHGVSEDKLRTYDVLEDQELRSGVKEFSEWPTFPQLYVDGEFVGGCDIILGMHQSGELEKLLEEKSIIPKHDGEVETESKLAS